MRTEIHSSAFSLLTLCKLQIEFSCPLIAICVVTFWYFHSKVSSYADGVMHFYCAVFGWCIIQGRFSLDLYFKTKQVVLTLVKTACHDLAPCDLVLFVTGIPPQTEWNLDPNASYVYYCANETVHGMFIAHITCDCCEILYLFCEGSIKMDC